MNKDEQSDSVAYVTVSRIAGMACKQKAYDVAIQLLSEPLEAVQEDNEGTLILRAYRAEIYYRYLKKFELCIDDCTTILDQQPQNMEVRDLRMHAYRKINKRALALKDYDFLLEFVDDEKGKQYLEEYKQRILETTDSDS